MCLLAPLVLPGTSKFPDISTLMVFSWYNLYTHGLTTEYIASVQAALGSFSDNEEHQYNGGMSLSLKDTRFWFPNHSWYVLSCSQRIYYATSSLHHSGDALFVEAVVDVIWNSNTLMSYLGSHTHMSFDTYIYMKSFVICKKNLDDWLKSTETKYIGMMLNVIWFKVTIYI